jgi:hypothetical protein
MGRRIGKTEGLPRIRVGELKMRRAEFSDDCDPAFVSFGGTTLYATSQRLLDAAIERLQKSVLRVCGEHLILPRASINKLVREELAEELDKSLIGTIVGRLLSVGELEALSCLSVNSLAFNALTSAGRAVELGGIIHRAEDFLRKNGTVSPREVQGLFFPDREWGTYMASSLILNHLAYLGRAVFLDRELFAWPKEVEDALRKAVR